MCEWRVVCMEQCVNGGMCGWSNVWAAKLLGRKHAAVTGRLAGVLVRKQAVLLML